MSSGILSFPLSCRATNNGRGRKYDGETVEVGDRKERARPKAMGSPTVREYSIDYFMSQLSCFPDLVVNEAGSDNLSRASRSNEWLYVRGDSGHIGDPLVGGTPVGQKAELRPVSKPPAG